MGPLMLAGVCINKQSRKQMWSGEGPPLLGLSSCNLLCITGQAFDLSEPSCLCSVPLGSTGFFLGLSWAEMTWYSQALANAVLKGTLRSGVAPQSAPSVFMSR